jgi:hypothetical protein
LVEWLITQVDNPPGADLHARRSAAFIYEPQGRQDEAVAVRVFYLSAARELPDLQHLIVSICSVTGISRITALNKEAVIILRATTELAAVAKWLIESIDEPTQIRAGMSVEYIMPSTGSPIVRVFYLQHIVTSSGVNKLRNLICWSAHIERVTSYIKPPVIIIRGTAAQVSHAMALVQQNDRPEVW